MDKDQKERHSIGDIVNEGIVNGKQRGVNIYEGRKDLALRVCHYELNTELCFTWEGHFLDICECLPTSKGYSWDTHNAMLVHNHPIPPSTAASTGEMQETLFRVCA